MIRKFEFHFQTFSIRKTVPSSIPKICREIYRLLLHWLFSVFKIIKWKIRWTCRTDHEFVSFIQVNKNKNPTKINLRFNVCLISLPLLSVSLLRFFRSIIGVFYILYIERNIQFIARMGEILNIPTISKHFDLIIE